jgi:hypothetical protein
LRKLSADPNSNKSSIDTLDPKRPCEKTDNEDPIREKFLREKLDPKWAPSRRENEEPNRVAAITLNPEPTRAKFLRLRVLAIIKASSIEQALPMRTWDHTDRLDPKFARHRTDKVDPTLRNSSTETAEPKRPKLLKLIEDPRCRKSNTEKPFGPAFGTPWFSGFVSTKPLPKIESELPRRAPLRKDIDDAIVM